MTSQVEFFCSEAEESTILAYLSRSGATFGDASDGTIAEWRALEELDPPPWRTPMTLLVRVEAHGPVSWHRSRPDVAGATPGALVTNLFAHQAWKERGLRAPDRLLDADVSPVLVYKRSGTREGRVCPHSILAPPSRLERAGEAYARWVRRTLSWVRRRGAIVHDYRSPSSRIPNPLNLLNTVYALPDVHDDLRAHPESFVIMSS